MYEDEIAKMRIERPEYEDEDDETMFNDIFSSDKASIAEWHDKSALWAAPPYGAPIIERTPIGLQRTTCTLTYIFSKKFCW